MHESTAREVFRRHRMGEREKSISRDLNVSLGSIRKIARGERWSILAVEEMSSGVTLTLKGRRYVWENAGR